MREEVSASGSATETAPCSGRVPRVAVGIVAGAMLAPAIGYTAEQSQPQAGTLEEVVITGSRIKRAGFETLQPAMVISSELIQERAQTNIAEALDDLPAFSVPGSSRYGGQDGIAIGQNFANFFGLGSQRTLTLVDGKRFVAANSPAVNSIAEPGLQVDLNTIPAALIDRIETIAVGGAPIYGADAIAGTVNMADLALRVRDAAAEDRALLGDRRRALT